MGPWDECSKLFHTVSPSPSNNSRHWEGIRPWTQWGLCSESLHSNEKVEGSWCGESCPVPFPRPCRSSCNLTYIGSPLRHPLYVRDKHQQALLCTQHDQKLTEGNGRTQDVQTPRAQLYNTCHAKSHAGEVLSRAQAPPGFPASSSLASPTQGSQAPPPPTHLGPGALLPQEP